MVIFVAKLLLCCAFILVPLVTTSRHRYSSSSASSHRRNHRLLPSSISGSNANAIDQTTTDQWTDQFTCAVVPPPLWCGCDKLEARCETAQLCNKYAGAIRNQPLHITLLYESLCPDCQSFITSTLFDVYQKFKAHIRIELIPFGNARVLENGTIKCQHGEEECRINKFHSCAIHLMHDPLPFIYCLEKLISSGIPLEKAAKKCYAKLHPLPHIYDQLIHCFNGATGDRLQKEAGQRTASIWPDQHEYVPWILVNNASLQSTQFLMNGLPTLICLSTIGTGENEVLPG
uniref:Saposin A-type domain-containing protein n=1 Tax=Globodera pallida TaxID=36090 RepID=A0A183C9V8_GLOPA